MNREEFEKWHVWCEYYNANGECGLLHEKCSYEACPNVFVFEKVEERIKELEGEEKWRFNKG